MASQLSPRHEETETDPARTTSDSVSPPCQIPVNIPLVTDESVSNPIGVSSVQGTKPLHMGTQASHSTISISRVRELKRPSHLVDLRSSKKSKNIPGLAPTRKEKESLKSMDSIPIILAEDLKDPDWETRNKSTASYTTVATAVSVADELNSVPDSLDVSKDSQKKHQINWLALAARQNEGALLERSATGKQKQRSTAMKYGW